MIEELQNIREQLFDAPKKVKESFNNLVNYFANENGITCKLLKKGNPKNRSEKIGALQWINLDFYKNKIKDPDRLKVGTEFMTDGNTYEVIAFESYSEYEKRFK